jgi:heterodisulfide reductase subunit B
VNPTTKYAYYPGCSLHSVSKDYDRSFRAVCAALEIELEEPRGWVCCGSSSAHATSRLLAGALPLYNLALAARAGHQQLVVPCAACLSRFKHAQHDVAESPALAAELAEVLGEKPELGVAALHPLQVLGERLAQQDFGARVVRDLEGLKVACYYGCLLTRPAKVMKFDEPEYPRSMDRIVKRCGARPLDWGCKTDCCGASFSLTLTEMVHAMTGRVLRAALEAGANCVAVGCTLCHTNLDARQREIEDRTGKPIGLPIFYFTDIVGLALGLSPKALGLRKHIVSPRPLLDGLGVRALTVRPS